MRENEMLRIAIDGPGGSGKSTIAKLLAKKLNLDYIDTGAMYRAIALKILNNNLDFTDSNDMKLLLDDTNIDFSEGSVFLDGENVDTKIRTPEVSLFASKVAAIALVREKLVELQKNIAATKNVVMDGRDIGTNVITDAEYKYYMIASVEERAARRYKELLEKGETISLESVKKDIEERDYADMNRELNPLIKAEDALELDTTNMSIIEVVEYIEREVSNGKG